MTGHDELRFKAEGVHDKDWMSIDARLVLELLDRIDELEVALRDHLSMSCQYDEEGLRRVLGDNHE